jgi:hypothetical protein
MEQLTSHQQPAAGSVVERSDWTGVPCPIDTCVAHVGFHFMLVVKLLLAGCRQVRQDSPASEWPCQCGCPAKPRQDMLTVAPPGGW